MSKCQNCGAETTAGRLFCPERCRDDFYNRMSKRGRVAMPLVLAWRAGRGSKGGAQAAFQELCAYADECNAEDRTDGRPPMSELIGYRQRTGELTSWRERKKPKR